MPPDRDQGDRLPGIPEDEARELYENAPCGYVSTQPDGTIVRVNQTLLSLTGHRREAVLGRSLQSFLTVPGRMFYETHYAPLLGMQGAIKEVALDLVRADGSLVPVLLNSVQQRGEDGRAGSIRTTLFDISDRRRYERELLLARRDAEQLAGVVSASGDAILLMSPDGTIRTWNRGAERIFGYAAGEAVGRVVGDLIVPADRKEEVERAFESLRQGREVRFETGLVARDGRPIDASVTLTPHVEALGEIAAMSSIIRDITERRRAQEQVRKAEQLEAVGTLAGGVAHEVNNQMAAVLGFGVFVLRALGPHHPQADDVQIMVDAAGRAARVSQQLLAFSRQQIIVPRILDVHAMLEELAPRLGSVLGPDQSLVVAPQRARQQARADSSLLEQILLSLVTNASDAMPAGGMVTLWTEDAVLEMTDVLAHPEDEVVPGPYVLLAVSDTGIGMDPLTASRIFQPFFTTKPIGQGKGLGLSMVYGIVKQHGGHIQVSSARGQGTAIRVYLPALSAEEDPALLPPSRRAPMEGASSPAAVLVVEDEAMLRNMARRTLEDAGLTVLEAENGRRALAILADSAVPPGLVLADLAMPGMSGQELGEAIGRRWPDLRILYTSAYPGQDMRAQGLLPDAAPFIQKPFSPDNLVARVTGLLRSGPSRDS
ncbi:MAG: PAS domain S-box protein [Gemmatimonadales bacterium]